MERGRILKADGTMVEAWEESDQSASEPWYRLYYDTRTRTLTFPALQPGDVLELAWRLDDTAAENLLSDYFGDLTLVAGAEPRRRFDYVLLAPADRPIHANAPPVLTSGRRELPGGLVEHRWQASDVARVAAGAAHAGLGRGGARPPRLHLRLLGGGRPVLLGAGARPAGGDAGDLARWPAASPRRRWPPAARTAGSSRRGWRRSTSPPSGRWWRRSTASW